MRVSAFQGVVHFIKSSFFRQQESHRSEVHDMKVQISEREAGDLGEHDLVHQPVAVDGVHAVIGCDDDVEPFAQAVSLGRAPQVTDRAIHLSDHRPALGGVRPILVSRAVGLTEVHGHEVQVLLSEPGLHHFVYVLSPGRFIAVIVVYRLHFSHDSTFTLISGRCSRKVEGTSLQTLFGGKTLVFIYQTLASVQPRVIIVNNN